MSWLALAAWGGLVGLDATSFPQVMVSRPFVAGTVAGLIVGRPMAGATLGALLEVFALAVLPIGAARNPEPGTAAVAAAAAFALAAPAAPGPGYLLVALAFGLLWERVGGASVHALRRWNESLVPDPSRRSEVRPGEVEGRHAAAMALDFVRGAVVAVGGGLVGAVLFRLLAARWPAGPTPTLALVAVAASVALGASLSVFDGWRRHRLAFGLGLLGGLAAVLA